MEAPQVVPVVPVVPVPVPAPAPAVPQLTQEQQQENAESGNYEAGPGTIIVCVGDLEGTSLKKLIYPPNANPESQSQTNVLTPTVSNLTELNAYLTVNKDGTLSLQENVILVYLGDVFGDGPNNIELATTLLKLKKDNPTRVILITGNRDLILERLPYELQPTGVCMTELIERVNRFLTHDHKGFNDAFNGFEFAFERNDAADFDYMWDLHPTNISEKKGCLERVIYVKESSMTEYYGWVFLVDEYLTTKGFPPDAIARISLGDKSYIYVYLVQVMAGAIDCDVPEFNGIFEKLLMNGHLIACIDAGDLGKFGFMHSLPPRGYIPTIPGAIYEEQYNAAKDSSVDEQKANATEGNVKDSDIKSANKVEINEGLRQFNQSFRELIRTHRSDPVKGRELLECVSGMTSGSYWAYQNNRRTGANMQLATVSFGLAGFNQYQAASGIKVQGGGTIVNLKDSIAKQFIHTKDFRDIIFGHKPQGYVGVKVKADDQNYYCVDVSKIDDQEYDVKERFGCCFLILELSENGVSDKFIGRIMLKQSQFPKDYNIFTGRTEDTTVLEGSKFACRNPMFANYILTPIPISKKTEMKQRLPLKIENKDYVFEYKVKPKDVVENRADKIRMMSKTFGYVTKTPTLTAPAAGGGSRTRKRRSRYLKKSARTTHKRRISKKLAQKNNKRKDKKSKRSSTAR